MKSRWVQSLAVRGLLAFVLAIGLSPASAQYYTVTALGNLPGGSYSFALAINDAGQVVGKADVGVQAIYPVYHAFLWDESNGMTDLNGYFGDNTTSAATGINSIGQVCGEAMTAQSRRNVFFAFRWTPTTPNGITGTMRTLADAQARGINDQGVVSAEWYLGAGPPLLWSNQTRNLPMPAWHPSSSEEDGPHSSAVAINAAGQVVVGVWGVKQGVVSDLLYYLYAEATGLYSGPVTGFYPNDQSYVDLGVWAGLNDKGQVAPIGINSKGWQVGADLDTYWDQEYPILIRHGEHVDLRTRTPSGTPWVTLTAINNNGQLVGYLGDPYGAGYAYRLDPVVAPPVADFKGDGRNDVVFQNAVTGQVAAWFLTGNKATDGAYLSAPSGPEWRCAGTGDFNGDGTADLIFQNTTTGQLVLWYMQGTRQIGSVAITPNQDPVWRCVSVHDFNGDGHPDLLFQNQKTGQMAIWYLNDASVVKAAFLYPTPDAGLRCAGTGDFDGDGSIQLLFQNVNTGRLSVWRMNGNYQESAEDIPMPQTADWQTVSVADYDGDGATDILFQNTKTGKLAVWYMGGTASADGAFLTPVPATNWQVVGPH